MLFECCVLLALSFILIYSILKSERDYWKTRNVPYAKGKLLVGNLGPSLFMFKSMAQIYGHIYKQFEGYKYCGVLNFRKPAVLILDIDIVQTVIVKGFNKFHDNMFEVDEKVDPILSKNPFFSRGEKWKQIRTQISPQFTAGKVKKMFPLIVDVCDKLRVYLENEPQSTTDPGQNAKELSAKFTADNIASCAFGLDGRSFVDEEAEFRKMGNKMMNGSTLEMIWAYLQFLIPEIRKIKPQRFLATDAADWIKSIVLNTIKDRAENNVTRNDFLDIIKELKHKTTEFEYTDDHLVAHCLTFFLDGFETSAVVLQYALYELGVNPDTQEKLKDEIDKVLSKYEGNITYDALQEMPYLDMVFLETLRKYPPLLFMSRVCTEETKFPAPAENWDDVVIEKGTAVIVPVLAIHHDDKYYPNPDKFDPYRFTEEAKNSRPKQTFLGFGDGPRICLGQRFATAQVKAGIVTVVSHCEIRVNKKTQEPLELDATEFVHAVKGGIWLNFFPWAERGKFFKTI